MKTCLGYVIDRRKEKLNIMEQSHWKVEPDDAQADRAIMGLLEIKILAWAMGPLSRAEEESWKNRHQKRLLQHHDGQDLRGGEMERSKNATMSWKPLTHWNRLPSEAFRRRVEVTGLPLSIFELGNGNSAWGLASGQVAMRSPGRKITPTVTRPRGPFSAIPTIFLAFADSFPYWYRVIRANLIHAEPEQSSINLGSPKKRREPSWDPLPDARISGNQVRCVTYWLHCIETTYGI